ncbi:MAG: methylmalonyl-CoA mutase family protein, partial [Ginsengibacter sp.]
MNDKANYKVRIVTAASLFDGHDAAINIMRRIMQSKGAEIIHLGHNRSVHEIVECAIEEDAHGIAVTSYQGGHVEFFKYMKDLLEENGCSHIKIFGGGGGTILPIEIEELHAYGITKIYSPDDGRTMGLEGMIEDVVKKSLPLTLSSREALSDRKEEIVVSNGYNGRFALGEWRDIRKIAQSITQAENGEVIEVVGEHLSATLKSNEGSGTSNIKSHSQDTLTVEGTPASSVVLGITGTGGAGKSSVTDEIVRRFLNSYTDKTVAVISVDPSKKKTGGALLGDRIRMNSIHHPRAYMRSLATRESDKALSNYVREAIDICKAAGYDFIILESAGVGQSDASILDYCDVSIYVMTPEYGAASQLEKINMLDYADIVCLNKFDKAGAADALHDVKKQYKRNHSLWSAKDEEIPVIGTTASIFNDAGVNHLFEKLVQVIREKTNVSFGEVTVSGTRPGTISTSIIPAKRVRYLAEIAEEIASYNIHAIEQAEIASQLYQVIGTSTILKETYFEEGKHEAAIESLEDVAVTLNKKLLPTSKKLIDEWEKVKSLYQQDFFEYNIRGKAIRQPLYSESLSHTRIPKIAVPRYKDWGDILRWRLQENFPGQFPYTAGVFPIKRSEVDPTRMFAGEGGPERTNRRFHYVSVGQPAKRLSTAFDSVTLYGEDPAIRPDIYGKVGNSGVSIASVDDAKKLYSGFDLCDPKTSVSMTINGPAPMLLAFFLNASIDQQCEKYIIENNLRDKVNDIVETKFDTGRLPKYIGIHGEPVISEKGKMTGHLPKGNDGLGLRLLGLSGEDVLDKEIYEEIK